MRHGGQKRSKLQRQEHGCRILRADAGRARIRKAATWPPSANSPLGTLKNLYVLSLPTLGPFDYAERDSLAFLQAAETVGLNRRIVNEYIFPF